MSDAVTKKLDGMQKLILPVRRPFHHTYVTFEDLQALITVARAALELVPLIHDDCDSTVEQSRAASKIKEALKELAE